MGVNGASTTFSHALWKILALCGDIQPHSDHPPLFKGKTVATTSLLCPKNVSHWSVNDFWPCIMQQWKGYAATLQDNRLICRLSR
jgi:hypothetical protein